MRSERRYETPHSTIANKNIWLLNAPRYEGYLRVASFAWQWPLDTAAEYTVASSTYILENLGDGFKMFEGCKIIDRSDLIDAEIMVDFLQNKLFGKIPERYTSAEGRIVLKK